MKARAVAAVALLLGTVTAVSVFSADASAHQSNISASVSCDGTVSWTASSWTSGPDGEHDDIGVTGSTDHGDSLDLGHGSFNGDNGYRFSGTTEWPDGATTMTITAAPHGAWGNGETSDDGDQTTIAEPDDCDHHPEVGKVLECEDSAPGHGDGAVTLTFTNPAGPFGHDADFEVSEPDDESSSSTYRVPSGDHQSVSYHGLSDGHHKVHVKVGDKEYDEDFEIDCDESVPSVEQSQACVAGDGSITVNLSNTGGEAADFTVENPVTGEVETITLQPDQSASRTFSGLADGDYRVPVHAGDADLTKEFTVDCDRHDDHDGGGEPPHECPSVDHGDDGHDGSTSTSTSVESDSESFGGSSRYGSTSTSVKDGEENDHTSSSTKDDGDDHTSSSVEEGDGDHHCIPDKGDGSIKVSKACVDHDGQVTVTLIVTGGDKALLFTVEGVSYSVAPDSSKDVVIGGLADGKHLISVKVGHQDLSFHVTIDCDLSPRVTVTQECVAFDGVVHLLLENLGDDADATFTVNGADHVVAPGESTTVDVDGLADGDTTITLAINGMQQADIVASFDCDPVFTVVAECNTISSEGAVEVYWFTVTNTESSDVEVSWDGGTVVVPAGESRVVPSTTPVLSLTYAGVQIATAQATNVVCSRSVTFEKKLIGQPPTGETYTITVSRLVGDTFVPEVTFDLQAGETKTIALPSTLDPAGIEYKVQETGRGSSNTSVVTPSELTLSGHLGQTVSVAVTNGYASVQLEKKASTTSVDRGGQLSYTLTAKNTNGLTLTPVYVHDRLPAAVSFVSASVAGGAGTCTLSQAARPQLVSCKLDGSLAAGATSATITITVSVDTNATPNTSLVNQGKVVGFYGPAQDPAEPVGADLSCVQPQAGSVCNLSARVGVTVTNQIVQPPVPSTTVPGTTTTTVPGRPLPVSGGSPLSLLFIAFGLSCMGGAMVLTRRRAHR